MKRIFFFIDEYLEEFIMVVLLIGMSVIMGIQIFCRYILGASLSWSEEITRYLFIWSAFLSVSLCTKKCISIKIDQFIRAFKPRGKALFKVLNLTIEFIFFVYLIPFAYRYLISTIESGQVSPACGIPMYFVQSAPLVCFTLCAIRILERWFLEWHNVIHREELKTWPSHLKQIEEREKHKIEMNSLLAKGNFNKEVLENTKSKEGRKKK
ncbi:TRAP transporter small permease [Pseudobutyrivibrio xylanivorans]|uniref:TRAP-type C4-dicarboxylate transport system, small permease component n=1 Tax=Pseudobutyrivibrio xylanivorans DSM 14809 TaxID=1123012 RepID=A0A1M6CQ62_PSEXY|nr:TRAP transporter small permease [Pseudobutyrivibrio xylanivorans]SHI63126.1 TRAP-type C4-dicarboxylate transport system, small permease component [Pseudobutyrivibrio xylanivorans DSM 14809]